MQTRLTALLNLTLLSAPESKYHKTGQIAQVKQSSIRSLVCLSRLIGRLEEAHLLRVH